MPASSSQALTLAAAADLAFWRALCPDLPIEGRRDTTPAALPALDRLHEILLTEGYVHEPDVLPRPVVDRLFAGIKQLHAHGIPPVFVFVYDDAWALFDCLASFLGKVLGPEYRVLPAFWAWYVEPTDQTAGWRPHRDRPNSLDPDNTPQSITVWLPLSHATPLNGCMYVLPAHLDANFAPRAWQQEIRLEGETLQNIRALPAAPGSLLAWNQALLHWGGRASRLGREPRCSLSMEFQRGDRPALQKGLIAPGESLSFTRRLGLIGHLMRQYENFSRLRAPEIRLLATGLEWKYFTA